MPRTAAVQFVAVSLAASADSCCAEAARSATSSLAARPAPSAMSTSRASELGYCGVSAPVRAQISRLRRLSAFRARCVSTWPRLQPGSSDGSRAWSSDSSAVVSSRFAVAASTWLIRAAARASAWAGSEYDVTRFPSYLRVSRNRAGPLPGRRCDVGPWLEARAQRPPVLSDPPDTMAARAAAPSTGPAYQEHVVHTG